MSNAQDFVTSFMKNLAEGVELTSSLQAVFAKILAEQVVVDADSVVNFKPAFSTLLKVLTFIATPEDKRPEAGSSYTQEAIDTAADVAATENGLTVGEEIPTEAPTDEPTDEPTEEPTDGPTDEPTEEPTDEPTEEPTDGPTDEPTEEPGVEGNTLELTTVADVIAPLAEGEEAVEGVQYTTENDDVINGLAGSYATTTLQKNDQIDGGAGHDTLNVELTSKFGGFTGDGFLKNVETVNLTNEGGSNRDFEAKQVEGVTTYNLDGLVNLGSLNSTDIAVNVANRAETGTVKIGYGANVADGTEDVLNLGVTNLGAAKTKKDAEQRVTVDAAGIENLNLTATGTNFVTLATGNKFETITVAGAGSLNLNGLVSGATSVDASALAGKLNLDLGSAAKEMTSIKGGASDDVITAADGSLAISAVVNGGAGQDKLVLTNLGTTTKTLQLQMEGVETLQLAGLSGDLTYSAAKTLGLEALEVSGTISGDAVFAGMEGDLKVTLDDASGAKTITTDNDGETTLNISSSTASKGDVKTVGTGVSFTKTANLTATVDEFVQYTGAITAATADAASLTLNGEVSGSASLELGAAQSLVINDNNKAADVLKLTGNKLEELTVNVANAGTTSSFTLASGSTATGLKSLNVTTNGKFDAASGSVNFGEIADLNLMGTGEVLLKNLGSATAEDSITLTAVGLAKNLTVGDINTIDGNSIDINVAEVLGDVTLGVIKVADKTVKTGTITIEANNTMGNISITSLHAKEVNFNAAEALGTVDSGSTSALTIEADTATFVGSGLGVNQVEVTAKAATIVGGIQADKITVNGSNVLATAELTGGLGADTFTIKTSGMTSGSSDTQLYVTITDFAAGSGGDNVSGFTAASFTSGLLKASALTGTGISFSATTGTISGSGIVNGKVEFANSTAADAFFDSFNDFDGVSGLTMTNTKLAAVDLSGAGNKYVLGLLHNNDFYTYNTAATANTSVLIKLVGVETAETTYDFDVA